MKAVSDKDDPQEVKEGKEVIFTYDVNYEVILTPNARPSGLSQHLQLLLVQRRFDLMHHASLQAWPSLALLTYDCNGYEHSVCAALT